MGNNATYDISTYTCVKRQKNNFLIYYQYSALVLEVPVELD